MREKTVVNEVQLEAVLAPMTPSQRNAFQMFLEGKDIFLFGAGGTGKSYTVKVIIDFAKEQGLNVLVAAPTGKAAQNVGGSTIHRSFAAGIGIVDPLSIFPGRSVRESGRNVLEEADIIVIDEVSMVRHDLFEGVLRAIDSAAARSGRAKQIVVVGDFYQLPPVLVEKKEGQAYKELYGDRLFPFQGEGFHRFALAELTDVVRQKDSVFIQILDRIREGDTSVLTKIPVKGSHKDAVTLCATNAQAKTINKKHLDKLTGKVSYYAKEQGQVTYDDRFAEQLLELAPGAHVLLVNNDKDERWINGTSAIVISCHDECVKLNINGHEAICEPITQKITVPEVEIITGSNGMPMKEIKQKVVGEYTQLPIKYGWAITIHKSQGMTLDKVNIDPSGCFAHGQFYVALSRCKTLEGVHLLSEPLSEHVICDSRVTEFMTSVMNGTWKVEPVKLPIKEEDIAPESFTANSFADKKEKKASEQGTPITVEDNADNSCEIMAAKSNFTAKVEVIKLIEKSIKEFAMEELRLAGIKGTVIVKVIEPAMEAEQEQKRAERREAKAKRASDAQEKLDRMPDAAVRQRLASLSDDTQSVYHSITDKAVDGVADITVPIISEELGVSPRKVESCLADLRESGLIASVGSRKAPKIRIFQEFEPSYKFADCLLVSRVKSVNLMRICQACPHLECHAHGEAIPRNKETA